MVKKEKDSPSNMINKLSLQQKIFPRQKEIADVILGASNCHSVTNAE